MNPPQMKIRNIRATAITVPMTYVLGTSAQAVREAPLLLIDLETESKSRCVMMITSPATRWRAADRVMDWNGTPHGSNGMLCNERCGNVP